MFRTPPFLLAHILLQTHTMCNTHKSQLRETGCIYASLMALVTKYSSSGWCVPHQFPSASAQHLPTGICFPTTRNQGKNRNILLIQLISTIFLTTQRFFFDTHVYNAEDGCKDSLKLCKINQFQCILAMIMTNTGVNLSLIQLFSLNVKGLAPFHSPFHSYLHYFLNVKNGSVLSSAMRYQ